MAQPTSAPDLFSLELLVAVAETGSLARAGERYRLSQPAVSMRIRSLERQFGLRLIERSPTGSRLTGAGHTVLEWSRPLLETARAMLAGVAALRSEQTGHLRLCASLTIAEYLLPAWLVGLHVRHPDVAVALEVRNSTEVLQLVTEGTAELGFVEGLRVSNGLRSREVAEDELVVVVARSHPWARRRRPITPAMLASTALVSREKGSGTREVMEALLSPIGQVARPALELGSTSAIKSAVLQGDAPAVLSRLTVAPEVATGQLVVVPVADLSLRRRLRVVWRTDRQPMGAAKTLLWLATGGRSEDRSSPTPRLRGGRSER